MKCRPLLAPSIINRVTKSHLKRGVGGLWSISQGSGVKSPKSSETSWHWICSKCWWMWMCMCSTIMSNILSRLVVRWRFKQTEGSRERERETVKKAEQLFYGRHFIDPHQTLNLSHTSDANRKVSAKTYISQLMAIYGNFILFMPPSSPFQSIIERHRVIDAPSEYVLVARHSAVFSSLWHQLQSRLLQVIKTILYIASSSCHLLPSRDSMPNINGLYLHHY